MLVKLPQSKWPMFATRGFTLIELLVTLAVLGILAAMGVPTYQSFLVNQQISSASSDFLMAMLQARSEAMRQGKIVAVMPANDTSWTSGWYLAVVNTDCAVTGAKFAISPALGSAVTIKTGTGYTNKSFVQDHPNFAYNPAGFPYTTCADPYYKGVMDGKLVFDASLTSRQKSVIVSNTGRARICDSNRENCVSAD